MGSRWHLLAMSCSSFGFLSCLTRRMPPRVCWHALHSVWYFFVLGGDRKRRESFGFFLDWGDVTFEKLAYWSYRLIGLDDTYCNLSEYCNLSVVHAMVCCDRSDDSILTPQEERFVFWWKYCWRRRTKHMILWFRHIRPFHHRMTLKRHVLYSYSWINMERSNRVIFWFWYFKRVEHKTWLSGGVNGRASSYDWQRLKNSRQTATQQSIGLGPPSVFDRFSLWTLLSTPRPTSGKQPACELIHNILIKRKSSFHISPRWQRNRGSQHTFLKHQKMPNGQFYLGRHRQSNLTHGSRI